MIETMADVCINDTLLINNCTAGGWNVTDFQACVNTASQGVVRVNVTCDSEPFTDILLSTFCELDAVNEVRSGNFSVKCLVNATISSAPPRKQGGGISREFRVMPLFTSLSAIIVSLWLLIQIRRRPKLHTFVNKLVASLCVCGMINSFLALIFTWPYDLMADPVPCLAYICLYCATFIFPFLLFMVISLERYLHIVHPFMHMRLTSNNRPLAFCVTVISAVSLFLAFVPFLVELKPYWRMACAELSFVLPFWLYALIYLGVLITATTIAGIAYINIFRVAARHLRAIINAQPAVWTTGQPSGLRSTVLNGEVSSDPSKSMVTHTDVEIFRAVGGRPSVINVEKGNGSGTGGIDSNHRAEMGGGQGWAENVHERGDQTAAAEQDHQLTAMQRAKVRKTASKARSAVPFIALYFYYLMSWAPHTAIKAYSAYTNQVIQPRSLFNFLDFIPMFSSTGYCLLYMYLEKDVRAATLSHLCKPCRKRRVRSVE